MKKINFDKAEFLKSALAQVSWPSLRDLSGAPMKEIVIAGRSNVGKSSLLNNLFLKKKLAKVSSTPGKTNTLNFFIIDDQIALVDLPGYGYAKVSKGIKENWAQNLDLYLKKRETIVLILLLIDIRRELTEEDIAFIDWSLYHRRSVLIIFTKCDKATLEEKNASAKKNLSMITHNTDQVDHCFYSIKDPKSRLTLIKTINRMMHGIDQ